MNISKGVEQKHSIFLKYSAMIVLFAIMAPSKYTGHCSSLKNVSDFVTSERTNQQKSPLPKPTDAIIPTSQVQDPGFSVANKIFSLSLILNHVAIVILSLLILGYLDNQPIVKRSLLFYLYKDFLFIFITLHCLWGLKRVIHYTSVNGHEMNDPQAKMMSFLIYFTRFQFLVFLNLITIINVYMIKKAMIDPPMPWGYNEDLGIKIIRFSTIVPVFVFITTMYMIGMYPDLYFHFKNGYDTSLAEISKGTIIFLAPIILLLITFIITSLVTIHSKYTLQQNLDTGIPQMHYYLVLLIVALTLLHYIFTAFGLSFIWNVSTSISIGTVVIQLVIILKNDQLTSYVKDYFSFDIFHLNIRFVCMCVCIYVFTGLCVN